MLYRILAILLLAASAFSQTGTSTTTQSVGGGINTSAGVVALFTACSGIQYLGADGACHNAATGAVSSVFTRTGDVVAASGDYTASQVTNAVANNAANVFTTGLQDFTAATMEIPESAGFTTNVDSTIGLDTTGNCAHFWTNNADSFNVVTTATSTTTTFGLFATAVPCIYTPRAIAAGDLPTTLTSGTAITNAALTTPTLGTPASGTLTNATGLPLNGLVGATAANTITETAVLRPTTFAGIETANLTYPWVFQNTNSANSNTSGALLMNCAGTDGGVNCVNINGPSGLPATLLNITTGGTVTNGVLSGQTTVFSVGGTGVSLFAAGAAGAATVTFAGDTTGAGLFRAGTTIYGFSGGTNEFARIGPTGVRGTNAGCYGMTSSATSSSGNYDTGWDRQAAGVARFDSNSACNDGLGKVQAQLYTTTTNCAAAGSAANPSVAACGAASSGSFSCATNASTGTCVVNTTAVTANSVIIIQEDDSLGTKLSVTCNTSNISPASAPISARSAATSFTINLGTITTNPECFSYFIVN